MRAPMPRSFTLGNAAVACQRLKNTLINYVLSMSRRVRTWPDLKAETLLSLGEGAENYLLCGERGVWLRSSAAYPPALQFRPRSIFPLHTVISPKLPLSSPARPLAMMRCVGAQW